MLSQSHILHNRYRVDRILGSGGMSRVYEAYDQRLGISVALKQAFALGDSEQSAFAQEAHLLAMLRHPALPTIIDYFTEDGASYLVMELIPGDDLQTLLARRDRPFEVEIVLEWAYQILDVLSYLHHFTPPIIHRDIKPANLKLLPDGRIMLLDFGIAKQSGIDYRTITGAQGITPSYSPLEQWQGATTDVRSDIYALGATIYHLLTGEAPPSALDRITRITNKEIGILSLHVLNPSCSIKLSQVVMKAMSIAASERFQSAHEFRLALQRTASTTPTKRNTLRDIARGRGCSCIIGLIILLLSVFLLVQTPLGIQIYKTSGFWFSSFIRWLVDKSSWLVVVVLISAITISIRFTISFFNSHKNSLLFRSSSWITRLSRINHINTKSELSEVRKATVRLNNSPNIMGNQVFEQTIEQNTIRLKHSDILNRVNKQVIEDLVLHEDYERLWRTMAYAEGRRYLLTGHGRFGGTSLITCAIEKARAELQKEGFGEGALLVFYFRLVEEKAGEFEIEANHFSLGNIKMSLDGKTSNLQLLKAHADKINLSSSSAVRRLDFSLTSPLHNTFLNKLTTNVLPSRKSEFLSYNFSDFVMDLNNFFEHNEDNVVLQQIISSVISSKSLPSRLIIIIDRVKYLETIKVLSKFDLFKNNRISIIIVSRKEDVNLWQEADERLREIEFTKWYVPCLWEIDLEKILFHTFAKDTLGVDDQFVIFKNHLKFVGRGLLGNFIDELRNSRNIVYGPNESYIDMANLDIEIIHNSWLQKTLDLNWTNILSNFFVGKYQVEQEDRARLGIYYTLDWISKKVKFTESQLLVYLRDDGFNISDDIEITIKTIENLLWVLLQNKYLLKINDYYRIIWDRNSSPTPHQAQITRRKEIHKGTLLDTFVMQQDRPKNKSTPLIEPSQHATLTKENIKAIQDDNVPLPEERILKVENVELQPFNQIFISYSHKDSRWLQRLQVHLKPLERLGTIVRWDDTLIKPGTKWKEEIRKALESARVAVLLVSADFLASDFIATNELPPLLAAAKAKGTIILPVIVSPCRFQQTESLSQFQAVNAPSQSLATVSKGRQESILVKVSEAIENALGS